MFQEISLALPEARKGPEWTASLASAASTAASTTASPGGGQVGQEPPVQLRLQGLLQRAGARHD